jgi:transcriptional regulator with XRE-family HTH domain
MTDDADGFWENVKKEIRFQNTTQEWVAKQAGISFYTFQGWISKKLYPRVDEAARIAASLNTSVDHLIYGSDQNNRMAIDSISYHLPKLHEHLDAIKLAIKELHY